jgi:hypothetical protein
MKIMKEISRIRVNKPKKSLYSRIDCTSLEMLGLAVERTKRGKENQEMGLHYCTAVV